ncbi:uncharacterized protein LOC122463702 [Chelonia mydas]|uniref:uncharacterized protein LOC122463702 n=1 Tax=Chelonia mydas TaxID=8469 RepID=UPI001CAA08A2|nr:uncharacterized protein LOC122463702 [Chelonia mydas]
MLPGRLPHSALWTAALLLWLGMETLGHIRQKNLHTIINYIMRFQVQYSFAVSLSRTYCDNPSGLKQELRKNELMRLWAAINRKGGLYDPKEGHIVAAQVNPLDRGAEHSEWRLLWGQQQSPVQKLLARTYNSSSCLIFFTLNSPCVTTCLQENGPYNILKMVSDTFLNISNDYKAFVFQKIYWRDWENEMPQSLLDAWHQLKNVPLLRCDNNGCRDCSGNDPNTNRCLARM